MKKLLAVFAFLLVGFGGLLYAQSGDSPSENNLIYKNRVIKIKPWTAFINKNYIGYEQKIKRKVTGEVSFGLIGRNLFPNQLSDKDGFYFALGPRFYFGKDYQNNAKDPVSFTGFYYKPEFLFSTYISNGAIIVQGLDPDKTFKGTSKSLFINLGRQFIAGDIITLEFSAGIGYSLVDFEYDGFPTTPSGMTSSHNNFNSHRQFDGTPLAGKAELSIGFLFR